MAVLTGLLPGADNAAILALNNAHAQELSLLDADALSRMIGNAFHAVRAGEADAFIIAFDQDGDYQSPNFLWFRERYQRFVYVDRIAVDPAARGRGLARILYEGLFERARQAGHERVVCEVNSEPPNPGSDAFHQSMGFAQVGSARLGAGKQVRYFERLL
jgi:uncharacterized protein